MENQKSDSAIGVFSEILALKRSVKVELNEGEYISIFSHLRTVMPQIAQHWHLIMKNKKVVGCSAWVKISVPTQKIGNATMKFNIDFRLPPKVSEEKAKQVYLDVFKNVPMKESASDESASEADVEDGLGEIGL